MKPPTENEQLRYLRRLGKFSTRTIEYGELPSQEYVQAFDVELAEDVGKFKQGTMVDCLCVSWHEDQIQVWEDGEKVAWIPLPERLT